VFLVDDEPTVRRGLRMQLELEADMAVVGEAAGGRAAIEQVARAAPDVVLMDLQMAGGDGLSATNALRTQLPSLPVVILSLHDGLRTRSEALAAGARAFVSKHDPAGVLLATIRRVAGVPAQQCEEDP
jgi:DNA-binding NarL/FixJ family response regulator